MSKKQDPKKLMVFVSKGTKTEVLGLNSIKRFPAILTWLNLNGRACHLSYLQSVLMMAVNSDSTNQAVMNIYTHDTIAYDQPGLPPFRLLKDYQK